jgi:hypothetical protein
MKLFDIKRNRSRFISEVNLRADVVYVLQGVERSDVLSVGMAQLAREGMLDLSNVPLDRRRSVLSKLLVLDDIAQKEIVVKILFIKRTDPFTGRIILNHKEMFKAFQQLGKAFAARYAQQRRGGKLRIELFEHEGSMSMVDSRKLFGQADVVIGPHGAGMLPRLITHVTLWRWPDAHHGLVDGRFRPPVRSTRWSACGGGELTLLECTKDRWAMECAGREPKLIVFGGVTDLCRTTSEPALHGKARTGLPRHLPTPDQRGYTLLASSSISTSRTITLTTSSWNNTP